MRQNFAAAPRNQLQPIARNQDDPGPEIATQTCERGARSGASGRRCRRSLGLRAWTFLAAIVPALVTGVSNVHAVLSEPDNILYGTVTLDNQLVTAARIDV